MAVPDRWEDLAYLFVKHPSQMSEIFWEWMELFVQGQGHLLMGPIPQQEIAKRAVEFSRAISDKGAGMQNFLRFIDGTVFGVARPKGYMQQLVVYNRHKRKHAFKYRAANTPDGMILRAYGPAEGSRHDWFLYAASGLEANMGEVKLVSGTVQDLWGFRIQLACIYEYSLSGQCA